jgi:hypothetical protein
VVVKGAAGVALLTPGQRNKKTKTRGRREEARLGGGASSKKFQGELVTYP